MAGVAAGAIVALLLLPATSFVVAEREEELAQARLRHTRASIDYLIAVADVDALTGDLLSRWGIALTER